ncbi:hypothetical protein FNO01nite_08330 [Flavobacterium noncentrifugens]|uniref:DUF3861 domain-containing protein n=1 Tax=Flavobacterium noncentrifugens TaxID=1128970 RepID=A0A1G8TD91_9FLAO|nr:DUF3861 domain-containing protein [Flavobacterium noncentrifugens]GEP50161.1 hypothetical protein FNO01nite_08330 [Flavobacterium noncentrifugens]SDJ38865.1 protein of unknown function [Flavobacterium noncentrifugens]
MPKKANTYKLTLEQLSSMKEDVLLQDPLVLEFENHDEIFKIIAIMREKNLFETENQSVEFAIGLKLFSEVMLKNRKHPLFEDFFPAFGDFMRKLKS